MEHYNFTGKSALIVHIATDTLIAQKKSDMCNFIWSIWTHSVNALFNNLKHMWDPFKWAMLKIIC